jgi:hypothetical protein
VRLSFRAHICGLVPPGSLAGVLVAGRREVLRPLGLPRLVNSPVTGPSWARANRLARGPCGIQAGGSGHAEAAQQQEEIVDGDAGRTHSRRSFLQVSR